VTRQELSLVRAVDVSIEEGEGTARLFRKRRQFGVILVRLVFTSIIFIWYFMFFTFFSFIHFYFDFSPAQAYSPLIEVVIRL
jgi:hypothetical protein